jgi:hypothetical protein
VFVEARRILTGMLAASALSCAAIVLGSQDWAPVRDIDGVSVEAKPTESGFHVHRARTSVCTDLPALEVFVADTSSFHEWIPFTRSARLLDESDDSYVYYVRSASPWPARDRDMIYRITRQETADQGLKLIITGLPDYEPPVRNAERIRAAAGEWLLRPLGNGIQVSYELYVDVGSVPVFFANRRLATVVGRTLANLSARFPCSA